MKPRPTVPLPATGEPGWPANPILASVTRGGAVESVHRGAWCLADGSGAVLEGAGAFDAPVFVRSAIKCIQALPLVESGAAERFGFDAADLALAVSSHDGEPCHVERARAILARIGLDESALQCGPQEPGNAGARAALGLAGERASALHNNCSGKHAGFLALARHLGVDPREYLRQGSRVQQLVRAALVEVSGVADSELLTATDGCSAPTFRMPLSGLATAFARVTNPEALDPARRAACRAIVAAVSAHPVMLAGTSRRLCTALVRASDGALFPKVGAEAVYAVGVPGADRALAVKIDDGGQRGLAPVVIALLERFGFLAPAAVEALVAFRQPVLRNWAGLETGTVEVHVGYEPASDARARP